MKLYLDRPDVEAIRRANDTGLLDGITTNPMNVEGLKAAELISFQCRNRCSLKCPGQNG